MQRRGPEFFGEKIQSPFLEEVLLKLRLELLVGFENAETEGRPSLWRNHNRQGQEDVGL